MKPDNPRRKTRRGRAARVRSKVAIQEQQNARAMSGLERLAKMTDGEARQYVDQLKRKERTKGLSW